MATPHVSGAAALVIAACNLDTAGVKAALLNNVDFNPNLQWKTITGGRLNLNKSGSLVHPGWAAASADAPAAQRELRLG